MSRHAMSRLDDLARSARSDAPSWDTERASRVLARTIDERDRRVVRARLARRAIGGVSAAMIVGLVLLRGASAPAGASTASPSVSTNGAEPPVNSASPEPLAVRDGDGGYARD